MNTAEKIANTPLQYESPEVQEVILKMANRLCQQSNLVPHGNELAMASGENAGCDNLTFIANSLLEQFNTIKPQQEMTLA